MKNQRLHQSWVAVLALAGGLLLQGCGMGPAGAAGSPGGGGGLEKSVRGMAWGGQQPVRGAHIQLYAVSNTATAGASTALLTAPVVTGNSGEFTLTGSWNCTDTATYGTDPLLYVVATGGNPGLSGTVDNHALVMMAAIGRCSTLNANSFLWINEVTTVAAAYALAPFMTDEAHVGSTKSVALANAFLTSASLANSSNGQTADVASGVTLPAARLYTLADVMATCVNSDGAGPPCGLLFAATTPSGGTAPTTTLLATLNLAHDPTLNPAAVFALSTPNGPFQPTLSSAPQDWALAINYSGSGIAAPAGLAVDAAGNVWIANAGGTGVTGLANNGRVLTGAAGETAGGTIFGAQAVAVDRSGNVWVADTLLSTVIKLAVADGSVTGNTTYSTGLNIPAALAIDAQNRPWITNFGDGTVTVLDPANGAPLLGSPFNPNGTLQAPAGVALDAAGNAWVADNVGGFVAEFSPTGSLLSGNGFSDGATVAPLGVAVSASGVYVADSGSTAVSVLGLNGQPSASSPLLASSLEMATGVVLDGSGRVWVTNGSANGALARVNTDGTVSTAIGSLATPQGIAVDSSGNVWTANSGDNTVTKFIGLASPAVTPLAAALAP